MPRSCTSVHPDTRFCSLRRTCEVGIVLQSVNYFGFRDILIFVEFCCHCML